MGVATPVPAPWRPVFSAESEARAVQDSEVLWRRAIADDAAIQGMLATHTDALRKMHAPPQKGLVKGAAAVWRYGEFVAMLKSHKLMSDREVVQGSAIIGDEATLQVYPLSLPEQVTRAWLAMRINALPPGCGRRRPAATS